MKVAIVTAVWNEWLPVEKLLYELEAALALVPHLEPSIWLVDDGSTERPVSWNALARGKVETQVIELQGCFGRDRALAAALGYLEFEREDGFDAFVLMDCNGKDRPSELLTLVETARRNPGCIVSAKAAKQTDSFFFRSACYMYRYLFRAFTGEWTQFGSFMLIPREAAAALCHSSHFGSHLTAAILKLRLKHIVLPTRKGGRVDLPARPRTASMVRSALAAISVFRELVFCRAFLLLCGLFLISATGAVATSLLASRGIALTLAVCACVFLATSLLTLVLSITSQSLQELRHWTPALDATTLIRSIHRVKREPYMVATENHGTL